MEYLQILLKGAGSAACVMAFSWLTVEWILGPIKAASDEVKKRMAALVIGQSLVLLAHWADIVSFGTGPKGWGAAAFFGFIGGGLAPTFHERIIKQYLPALSLGGGNGGKVPPVGGS